MAETSNNARLDSGEWLEVYNISDMPLSSPINIQNIGVNDLYYIESNTQPSKENLNYKIFKRGEFISVDGDCLLWIFSPNCNGLINASINELALKIQDSNLNTENRNSVELLEMVLIELRILRLHHEQITDQIFKSEDIDE